MNDHTDATPARHLLLTQRGEAWLSNFEESDRGTARELAAALSLVSLTEFERRLERMVDEKAQAIPGPVALFGIREVNPNIDLFVQAAARSGSLSSIDATPGGADIGSEGRVANLIRNLAKSEEKKYLNHPTVNEMRARRCQAIFLLDDLFGSGMQCRDYLNAIWTNRTIRSWASYRKVNLVALAYAGTEMGVKEIGRHRSNPSVVIYRHCPTVNNLPWEKIRVERIKRLCVKYASLAGMPDPPMGFGNIGSLLVFEHGCPDNAPLILWDEPCSGQTWNPLFYNRRVASDVRPAFPEEMARRDPVRALIEAGQFRLAATYASVLERPLSAEMILAMALISKGLRRPNSIAGATGLSLRECQLLLEKCIDAGFITPNMRITELGLRECNGMSHGRGKFERFQPKLGSDEYHPRALRDHVDS